jgi:CubicO group peptidase (beta-lactamase class C family)
MKYILKHTLLILIILIAIGCKKDYSKLYPYSEPLDIGDGLSVGSLNEVGMDEDMLRKAVGRIDNGKYGEIHSMLIYKDEKLVFEDYYEGHKYQWDAPGHFGEYVAWDKEMQHCIHSDTKSIVSLCIGIALDKGFIENINQSIFDYLPNHQHFNINNKEYVTIEHLLTMNSGLRWNEWGVSLASIDNDQIGIWFWEDGPMNYVLSRELVAVPGTRFNYSGGDIQILVEILKNATGMPLDEFSEKYLFEPLGITSFDWWLNFPNGGEIQGAGGLKLTLRDMVKIGAMMLNNGVWNGKQIVSEAWVNKCRSQYSGNSNIKIPGEDLGEVGYAYTWWTKEFTYKKRNISMFFVFFCGGQKFIVMPELDMVIAFTGANYNSKVHQFEIIERFILPAIE